jgi:DNA-directed RNA polymerase subunit RPC12/RpoP
MAVSGCVSGCAGAALIPDQACRRMNRWTWAVGFPVDDTLKVRCSRCKSTFREKARRVQSGYSRECPGCGALIFFEEGSANECINRAFKDAQAVRRKILMAQEAAAAESRARTQRGVGDL